MVYDTKADDKNLNLSNKSLIKKKFLIKNQEKICLDEYALKVYWYRRRAKFIGYRSRNRISDPISNSRRSYFRFTST